jgi:hypothetical protein
LRAKKGFNFILLAYERAILSGAAQIRIDLGGRMWRIFAR